MIEAQRTRTDLVYSCDHGPRWRTLPFGAGALLDAPSAAGGAPAADRLADRLLLEHQDAHRALFGAHDGTSLERVVLLGDGARSGELRSALHDRFGVEVVVPHSPRHFVVSARVAAAGDHGVLRCGTAIGLAVAALSRRGEPDSLIAPPRSRRALRRLPALSAALLLVSLGLLATGLLADETGEQLATELVSLRERVRWSAAGDFRLARENAEAAAAEARRLIRDAAALRREIGFPSRLLSALSDPGVYFKLVSLELTPRDDGDEAGLVFEVAGGLAGAADAIRAHLERHAGVSVIDVQTRPGEGGALEVALRAVVHARKPGP